ncbi:hypothetical protein ACWIGI_32120 [Nocardia sp. NPDC055321]
MATAVPAAALLLAVQPGTALAQPDLPSLGEILSGSAGSEGSSGGAIDAPSGSALGLGTGGSAGSGSGGGAPSGSALGLPDAAAAVGIPLETGSAAGIIEPVLDAVEALALTSGHAAAAAPGTLGESLGFENGSVLTACTGSAVAGSAILALGIVTGSGFGSGLIGPGFVPGSSGLVGPGSSGLGSVVVGSAVLGSAGLTCLLLLPMPLASPGIPLGFPASPAAAPAPAPEVIPVVLQLVPFLPPPPRVVPPPPRAFPASEPLPEPEPWSALQMMTVIVLTIIAATRAKIARGRGE